ncbi:MAG TPA: M20/M25/M40 family metallo-hydrolase [Pirellulales bacterium]|nr:M20/M25/M40 family metallo-hydrolase [Pirellulales bacterium]
MRRIAVVALLVIVCQNMTAAAETAVKSALSSINAADLRRHVERLADDTLEGREAGSRGGQAAGHYLGREFQRHGLAGGANSRSYYQSFGAQYRNILGLLEGSDPKFKSEMLLIGAHYDHVGYGNAQNSYGPTGYIHNGADDNASGVAGLLELIEAFSRLEQRPKRSILFALWDGEEKGLLGSEHWVSQPTVPLERVKLAINLDMIGRLGRNRVETYGIRTTYGLRRYVSMANAVSDLPFDFSWTMREDSDHYSFYKRNVPVLMFHSGLHSDYHRPSDDVEKLDFAGMERITQMLFTFLHDTADAPKLYGFRSASRSENAETRRRQEQPLPPLPSRLGIAWRPADEGGQGGVVVANVMPTSPASRAGLRVGDRIVQFADQEVKRGADLRDLVLTAESPVSVNVERSGAQQPLKFNVQLTGPPIRLGISWRSDDAEPGVVIVARVVPGSPAANAGIRVNDRIYEVAGQAFSGDAELRQLLAEHVGPLDLLTERQGRLRRISLTPLSAPATEF